MNKPLLWSVVVIALASVAGYYAWNLGGQGPEPAPLVQESAPPRVSSAPAPSVRHPIETTNEPGAAPLPSLDESDEAVGDALARALGGNSLPSYFYPRRMIRRFVATIDNLPRKRVSARLMPVEPVAGRFIVGAAETELVLGSGNSARYKLYIAAMERADLSQLVEFYVRFYPLFQQAYAELGYPKGYFNDRLVETIDDLLDAPDAPASVRLVQPHVLYLYADHDLEALSAGQKILIRMGRENAERVKTVLRAFRSEVVGNTPRN